MHAMNSANSSSSSGGNASNQRAAALPAVLLVHIASFLGKARAIVSLLGTCKAWQAVPDDKLDPLIRALYQADFELDAASASDPYVASSANASWRARYAARARLDENWKRGRFVHQHLFVKGLEFIEVLPRLNALVCATDSAVRVLALRDGRELCCLPLPQRVASHACLKADESTGQTVLAVGSRGSTAEIAFGQNIQVWRLDLRAPGGRGRGAGGSLRASG